MSHAYIIEGMKNGSKGSIALDFAKAITPFREDILTVSIDGLSVKDQSIEALQGRLAMKPLVGDRIVAIIEDADTMTTYAQNRLLKTLEEPAGAAVLILLSENVEHLLPTIRSRCILFRLDEEESNQGESNAIIKERAASIGTSILNGGSFYTMVKILNEVSSDRIDAYSFLDDLEIWFRDLVFHSIGVNGKEKEASSNDRISWNNNEQIYRAVFGIEEARRQLDRHVNTGYVVKSMILKLL